MDMGEHSLEKSLMDQVFYGNLGGISALVAAGANVNTPDGNGDTPLLWAVEDEHAEVVQALIAAGADANFKGSDGAAPLHVAARKGHAEITKALAEAGADMEAKDSNSLTPLELTAKLGHVAAAQSLVMAGAKPLPKDARFANNNTLVGIALLGGCLRHSVEWAIETVEKNPKMLGKTGLDFERIPAELKFKLLIVTNGGAANSFRAN